MSVRCFLKHVGVTTRIRGGELGAKKGGGVVVFIACVLRLGSGRCLNIVMQETRAKQLAGRPPGHLAVRVSVSVKDNK